MMSIGSTGISLPGLSGYDFSGIIDKLVQVERLPELQMQKTQTDLQTRSDAWRDVNTRLQSLDTTLTTLKDASTWTATSASSSNTSVLKASSTAGAAQGIYSMTITQTAAAQTVVSAVQSSATTALNLSGTFSIMSGKNATTGVQVTVAATDTLTSIASKINGAGAGVNAAVVQTGTNQYQLAITNNSTGTDNQATFQDVSGTVLGTGLGLLSTTADANHTGYYLAQTVTSAAKDASFTVNGIAITSQSNTVTTAVPGVTFNFVSLVTPASPQSVTLNVSADTSVAQKAVQAFVDQYNSTMDFIATKLNYDTTTKIKGDLFGDATLQGVQSRLRTMVGGVIANPSSLTGPYNILGAVGITTSSANFGKEATLTLDTAKFTSAMAVDPKAVANLFGASYGGGTPNSTTEGLANIAHTYLYPMIMYGGTIAQTQDMLASQIKDVKDRMGQFEQHVLDYQEHLKLRFANLESVLAGFNSQASWLSTQMSSLSASTTKK
ncbi:MAG: flagellar filament capping protein FliD [Desulfitobacteriaceae bacterium]|nr:flagellar filament capping protein FliD [Desulfitobacteriaceae bacterium]MDI6912946.1 flagellar filament capping protein FliD [Desulfitobacteriaceae bacterium]